MRSYIGIDIGGTSFKIGIVKESGEIISKTSIPASKQRYIVFDIVNAINNLLSDCQMNIADITAVGMGIPGMIDAEGGIVKYSNNIKIKNLSIVKDFQEKFPVPTYIANDADAAALGEVEFGSAKGKNNVIFVTLGTGVGTGIVLGGKLLPGSEGGHMVIETNGIPCTCGRRGCFECYASATAMRRLTKDYAASHPDSLLAKTVSASAISAKTGFDCAKRGDKVAEGLVDKYLEYIASGITSLANLFSPECVLIGGGVSNEDPIYFSMVEEKVNRNLYGYMYRTKLPVIPATLKNDAGILGAVALAISEERNR